uniref:Minichromosome maintenance protein 2 n=1 Tax=Meloidogyne incognita TaxID=6306 RepID=A0A914N5Y3_MELIC
MSDTGDNESVAQSRDGQEQVDDNVVPASDNEEDDPIAELYGDEREEYEEEDANGEDLFRDDMLRDYRDQPELDNLSASGIDDTSDITELSFDARRRAEIAMARRDQLSMEDELYWEDGDESAASLARRRKRLVPRQPEEDIDEDDGEVPIDILENYHDRSARDHCSDEAVGREVFRRFKKFLNFFKEPVTNQNKYILSIRHMVAENRLSLEVDYNDLSNENGEPHIAFLLPEAPVQVLERLDQAVTAVVTRIFPWYKRVTNEVKVRVKNLPSEEDIRLLRQIHLNMLIKTSGVVTVTTGILPQLSVLKYDCKSCSFVLGPFVQRQDEETKPTTCPSCQSRGPFELNTEETIYHNYQRITIQESPNLVAAGRLPRSKEVILLGDLCDSCKPGDEIVGFKLFNL